MRSAVAVWSAARVGDVFWLTNDPYGRAFIVAWLLTLADDGVHSKTTFIPWDDIDPIYFS